jgi:hypothetical protein
MGSPGPSAETWARRADDLLAWGVVSEEPAHRFGGGGEMLDSIFDFAEIRVTSRRPESREAFAERLRAETDTPVRVTSS